MGKLLTSLINKIKYVYGLSSTAWNIVIVALILVLVSTLSCKKKETIPVYTIEGVTVTATDVVNTGVTNSTSTAKKIAAEINSTTKQPEKVITTATKLNDSQIITEAKKVNNTATAVIKKEKDEHTTNVYAIDASKKAQHALGVYGQYRRNTLNSEYGVFYRNKRFVYSAGIAKGNKYTFGVGYEVLQW